MTDRAPAGTGDLEIHVMVDDLDATIVAIRYAGGTVDPVDVHSSATRWASFTDPAGNRPGIYQHRSG